MSRSLGFSIAGLCLAVGAACHTGERLWRVTPFEGGASSERINLWPLAYNDGDETSVLWPLFDIDDQGFALRPLVAKDGSAYSILFPLASFDTRAGEGWFVPFYWYEGSAGLFPLAHMGDLSWVGPVWWSERSSGVFPIAQLGKTSWVGPFWWTSGENAASGLFPIAMFAGLSYVGPFWWARESGAHGLFPLYGRDLLGAGIDHVGPVWWRTRSEEGAGLEAGLLPLVWYGDGGRSLGLLPLYSHELGTDARTRNVLLGLGHSYRSDTKRERWLLPLYYQREEPEKSDSVLVPFYWKRTRAERSDVYTLLGNRSVAPDGGALNLYPLWWSSVSGESAWKMLFPFFWYGRDGDERTLITPLGGRGWSASGDDAFVNFLGPLYHRSVSTRRDESRTAFLWPLFERHRRGEEVRTRMAGLYSSTSSPGQDESYWGFGLGHAQRDEGGSSQRLWPLYSWSNEEDVPGLLYDLTLYGRRRHGDSSEQRVFPFFSSASSAGGSQWNALLGLVHHESRLAEGSERTWAWPLFARASGTQPGIVDATALWGSAHWEGGSRFQVGASLLHSRWREEGPEWRRSGATTLFFFTHDEEEFVAQRVPAAGSTSRQNLVRRETRGFLFDAFVSASETYRVWRDGVLGDDEARTLRTYSLQRAQEGPPDREAAHAVLAARGLAPPEDDPEALRRAILAFADENTRSYERRHVRMPLLWNYERTEDELEWSGPLGLVSYESGAEHSRLSLLYYAYRSETEGERTSRDIFPFITWDSGPAETRISFLWRLFHYERKGERRGGHVLFIPWGDV